ncbi:Lrp/AsnC family transcriptional regulator [Hoeflea prorocentri]|uniref:Lrp/AsnC family transcriptional regulator n=1 Tax=Hoeflea prorocentri TaxID=1922333 RepID=A0A9X3ZJH2_9HYPH|nr:Lrp/AsnC family transcriptional regulator [Hoeflea prorocentri]MCY6383098.1 Lrp/AsnC family transcriptional regulator [Hoeflea prorocentri]MDA5400898.1 Lrp/AsnC family transcriptional regulator [Hoeflea prorocentri]
MDKTDQKLISALRHDGRAAISDLAVQLGVSRATVRTRLERLMQSGEILGFSVILRSDAFEQPVRGIMLLSIEGRGTDRIVSQLRGMPEITAIHTTNGKWDLVLELGTDTLSSLDTVLHKIRLVDGIRASETNLYLGTRRSAELRTDQAASV